MSTTTTPTTTTTTPRRSFLTAQRLGHRYQRKTRDTWEIWINYGHGDGWEHECTELSRAALRENLRRRRSRA